ncbi:chemotaxis protein CheD [Nitratidesulfovibrio sp. SRB-5]|uniref:chemotaxis protein CheD n=1 Tax=Nitratidesulfovibrio sp. SRB-5 TaxID=2872636 RepID=UPI0010262086|nr:chemotaxis protein CheD [Nitratidesulfovibrio sp. SRB-5]MBZ2172057.1 chemotaxis protein CheD [Nitratidesulfovibrio sp. SRB-5]RXF77565.1 chemotaxis protein CheD [Desulfovibrio sp. DS-1]
MPRELAEERLRHLHLRIGEGIVARRPAIIATVLGSCVSATFFHRSTGLAGIFHAMLPTAEGSRDFDCNPCKYVDTAVEAVLAHFLRKGVPVIEIETKLFGGAFSMNTEEKSLVRSLVDVGGRNVQVARDLLRARGLVVSSEHVLGERGRKLLFHAGTGEVWVKLLRRSLAEQGRGAGRTGRGRHAEPPAWSYDARPEPWPGPVPFGESGRAGGSGRAAGPVGSDGPADSGEPDGSGEPGGQA